MENTLAGIATDLSVWQESNAPLAMLVVPAGIVTAPFPSGVIEHTALTHTGRNVAAVNTISQPNKVAHVFFVRCIAGMIKLWVEFFEISGEDGMRSERDNPHSVCILRGR